VSGSSSRKTTASSKPSNLAERAGSVSVMALMTVPEGCWQFQKVWTLTQGRVASWSRPEQPNAEGKARCGQTNCGATGRPCSTSIFAVEPLDKVAYDANEMLTELEHPVEPLGRLAFDALGCRYNALYDSGTFFQQVEREVNAVGCVELELDDNLEQRVLKWAQLAAGISPVVGVKPKAPAEEPQPQPRAVL